MQFAQNLKRIMQEKNITNYRLAKILGVHPTTIKNWLESNTEPKFEMIDRIANALEVSTSCLIGVNEQALNDESNETAIKQIKQIIDNKSNVQRKMYNLYSEAAENPIVILQFFEQLNHTGRIKIVKTLLDIVDNEKYTETEEETTDNFSTLLNIIKDIKDFKYTAPDEE